MRIQVMGRCIMQSFVDRCKKFVFYFKWNRGVIGDFEQKSKQDFVFVDNLLWDIRREIIQFGRG